MVEKKMDCCDAKDQSGQASIRRRRSVRSRRRHDQSPTSSCDTTLGMIKGSPSRKRSPNQEEEDEETHVETKIPKILADVVPIPNEANITIHEGNPNNGHTQEEEGEAGMFHPSIYEGVVYGPSLMFEKELRSSDVASDRGRLLITGGYYGIAMLSLKAEERREVYDEFLRVLTTDKNGVEYALGLKWVRRGAIALVDEWSKLVRANGLKKGDSIEVYGYRVGSHEELRLALHVIPK